MLLAPGHALLRTWTKRVDAGARCNYRDAISASAAQSRRLASAPSTFRDDTQPRPQAVCEGDHDLNMVSTRSNGSGVVQMG